MATLSNNGSSGLESQRVNEIIAEMVAARAKGMSPLMALGSGAWPNRFCPGHLNTYQ